MNEVSLNSDEFSRPCMSLAGTIIMWGRLEVARNNDNLPLKNSGKRKRYGTSLEPVSLAFSSLLLTPRPLDHQEEISVERQESK